MSYGKSEAADLILKACRELKEHKLIIRTWGNISARISSELMLITPSGRDYDTLTAEDLVTVNIYSGLCDEGKTPSSEAGVHMACYQNRPEVNFVIHTHQPYASALSVLGHDIKLGERVADSVKELLGEVIACASYGPNGSKKINKAVTQCLVEHPDTSHVLMKNHGALCFAEDYEKAFKVAYTLEALSEKVYERYISAEMVPLKEQVRRFKVEKEHLEAVVERSAKKTVPQVQIIQSVTDDVDRDDEKVGMWILHVRSEYIVKMSQLDSTMKAYLDDLAQIAGPSIRCISAGSPHKMVMKVLGSADAILVHNDGAYCTGSTYDEALCVAEVMEKGCLAAYLAMIRGAAPLGFFDAFKDRRTYTKKYSKLMTQE